MKRNYPTMPSNRVLINACSSTVVFHLKLIHILILECPFQYVQIARHYRTPGSNIFLSGISSSRCRASLPGFCSPACGTRGGQQLGGRVHRRSSNRRNIKMGSGGPLTSASCWPHVDTDHLTSQFLPRMGPISRLYLKCVRPNM